MKKLKRGRHAPAFVLLIIAQKPAYGLEILSKLNEGIAENNLDTAVIYRSLKSLEADGRVASEWVESESGAPKKVYHITESGLELLDKYSSDIEISIKHLNYFMEMYRELRGRGK